MAESFEPRASPSSGQAEAFASQKERVFGGGAEDRAASCKLFSADFERENAEAQEREFDFVFRHGTVILKVEEDEFGRIVAVVSGRVLHCLVPTIEPRVVCACPAMRFRAFLGSEPLFYCLYSTIRWPTESPDLSRLVGIAIHR